MKAKSKPEPVAKAKVKARELPPVKSSEEEEEEEASAEQDKGGAKKKARRSKADFPDVPPGEPAPRHRGKANAQGELYPGYRKGRPPALCLLRAASPRFPQCHQRPPCWMPLEGPQMMAGTPRKKSHQFGCSLHANASPA